MARMKMKARDGTVYAVFYGTNGDYVAAENEEGSHYAPSPFDRLPRWSDEEAREALARAVSDHEYYQYANAVAEAKNPNWREE